MPPCDPRKLLQHSSQHQTDYQQLLRNISRLAEHAKNLPIATDDPMVGEETIVGSNVLTSASVAVWTKGTSWNMFVSFELFIFTYHLKLKAGGTKKIHDSDPWWLFWHPNIPNSGKGVIWWRLGLDREFRWCWRQHWTNHPVFEEYAFGQPFSLIKISVQGGSSLFCIFCHK